jgi:hypothetical protein
MEELDNYSQGERTSHHLNPCLYFHIGNEIYKDKKYQNNFSQHTNQKLEFQL